MRVLLSVGLKMWESRVINVRGGQVRGNQDLKGAAVGAAVTGVEMSVKVNQRF